MDKFLNNTCSSWGIVKYGVLQGSPMGPLHFLNLYNGLPSSTINTNLNDNLKIILLV